MLWIKKLIFSVAFILWIKRAIVVASIVFALLAVVGTTAFLEAREVYSTWTFEGSPK